MFKAVVFDFGKQWLITKNSTSNDTGYFEKLRTGLDDTSLTELLSLFDAGR